MAEQLNVGDLVLDKLLIHASAGAYDLIPHLVELNIYENLFSNHITGNITLTDGYNIPQKLPIIGTCLKYAISNNLHPHHLP